MSLVSSTSPSSAAAAGALAARRRIGLSLAALGAGGMVLVAAALIQLAPRLPATIQANRFLAMLVRGYDFVKPALTGYSGPRYLGLLGVGVGIYWLLPLPRWRRPFLLAYSLLLGWFLVRMPVAVLLGIGLLILAVHLTARALVRQPRAAWAGIAVIAASYLALLAMPLASMGGQVLLEHVILQGYFMFLPLKTIHYLWDVATGKAETCSLQTLALWILFFPSFRNAPFERIQSFAAQTAALPDAPAREQVKQGIKRLLLGIVKGAIGSLILLWASPIDVWSAPLAATAGQLWLAAYGYAIGMFVEFSGFADAMIGSSALLGYRLRENFDRPYLQPDVRHFWRGWNITTSRWLLDYVYIPLGGSRRGNVYFNQLATMLAAGVWHALNPNFVIWGGWHALGLMSSLYLSRRRRSKGRAEPAWQGGTRRQRLAWVLGVVATFHFVTVGWVFHHNGYNGQSALDSLRMVARMFGLG